MGGRKGEKNERGVEERYWNVYRTRYEAREHHRRMKTRQKLKGNGKATRMKQLAQSERAKADGAAVGGFYSGGAGVAGASGSSPGGERQKTKMADIRDARPPPTVEEENGPACTRELGETS